MAILPLLKILHSSVSMLPGSISKEEIMKALAIVTVGILSTTSLWAAESAGTPASFMGVSLQGDFLKDVDECPASSEKLRKACRIPTENPDQFIVRGLKSSQFFADYQLVAHLTEGKVDRFVFSGPTSTSYLVTDMLRSEYGASSEQEIKSIKMKSGVTFESEELRWNSEKLSIVSKRNDDDLSTYSVILTASPTALSTPQDLAQPSNPGVSGL